jgi:UDPglucose 6-dehydrogenase
MASIGFAGLSHLGIVSSVAAAAKGFEVTGYDPDEGLCGRLTDGALPIMEPQLAELLAAHRGRIRWTNNPGALKACNVVVCSADVPTGPDHVSDLSLIEQLTATVAAAAAPDAAVVILSQVPPGFTRRIARQHRSLSKRLFCQVETLIFGQAVERALKPERLIVGCADPQAALPAAYAEFLKAFDCPILPMRYESAELAKISINMFLVSSVAVTNTLAELCEAIGAEWSDIVPALQLDRRIGPYAYVKPGLGLAGGNLERDLMTVKRLAAQLGTDAGVIDAWLANSRSRRDWVLKKLHADVLSTVRDPLIAIWGLAYKPGTASTKNSAALSLLEALRPWSVRTYDPHVDLTGRGGFPHVIQAASALEACRGADALAIMTPWPEFRDVRPAQVREFMRGRTILDPLGVLDRGRCEELGLRHVQLGLAESTRSGAPRAEPVGRNPERAHGQRPWRESKGR